MSKKQIIVSIISITIMLLICIVLTINQKTIAVAALGAKFYNNHTLTIKDFQLIDSTFNRAIIIELGIFSLLQVVSYSLYLFQQKKALIVLLVIELMTFIIGVIGIINNYSDFTFMVSLPIINIILYLIGLKDNKKKQ